MVVKRVVEILVGPLLSGVAAGAMIAKPAPFEVGAFVFTLMISVYAMAIAWQTHGIERETEARETMNSRIAQIANETKEMFVGLQG